MLICWHLYPDQSESLLQNYFGSVSPRVYMFWLFTDSHFLCHFNLISLTPKKMMTKNDLRVLGWIQSPRKVYIGLEYFITRVSIFIEISNFSYIGIHWKTVYYCSVLCLFKNLQNFSNIKTHLFFVSKIRIKNVIWYEGRSFVLKEN